MLASAALGFVLALPLFWVMLDPALALLGQLCIVLIIGPYIGVTPALLGRWRPFGFDVPWSHSDTTSASR